MYAFSHCLSSLSPSLHLFRSPQFNAHHVHDLIGSTKHPLGQHSHAYVPILPRKKLRVKEKSWLALGYLLVGGRAGTRTQNFWIQMYQQVLMYQNISVLLLAVGFFLFFFLQCTKLIKKNYKSIIPYKRVYLKYTYSSKNNNKRLRTYHRLKK